MICWGMLFVTLTGVAAYPARMCTGVKPIDLLGEALSEKFAFPSGVEIVTTDGIKGYRFDTRATVLGVDGDSVLGRCARLPAEFSVQVNFRQQAPRNSYEYLMTLLAPDRRTALLSLRLRRNSVALEYVRRSDRTMESVNFASELLGDGEWHNLVVSYTDEEVKFTLDCVEHARKLDHPIASDIDVRKTRFSIGSKRQKRNRFTGILRQLIFLPGSDVSNLICPSPYPSLAAVRDKLPSGSRVGTVGKPVIFQSDQPHVTCSVRSQGSFLYADDSTLKICNDGQFRQIKSSPSKMEYVVAYSFLTPNRTVDIEVFDIAGEGHFLATANDGDKRGTKSNILKWNGVKYVFYQNLPSKKAYHWKHFTIGSEHFLALANSGRRGRGEVSSCIFRWHTQKRKFVRHQLIPTFSARSWEAFEIDGRHYIAVANHMDDQNNTRNLSEIYSWDPDLRKFAKFQSLPSVGAVDVEFLRIEHSAGTFHLLTIANAFDGETSKLNSSVFYWAGGRFAHLHDIETVGVSDIEAFEIDGFYYLAVANAILFDGKVSDVEREHHITSCIYQLNDRTRTFEKIQDIETHGARDWEFFTVGVYSYLILSNLEPQDDGVVRSVIYRWQGVENFVSVHNFRSMASADYEAIRIDGEQYLALADPGTPFSQLYKIVAY